jgi:hypothetical protein
MTGPGDTHGRLLRLATSHPADREVTIYIKGFLGRGERPEQFGPWLASHRELAANRGWGARAYGYSWPAGRVEGLPLPKLSAVAAAWHIYRGAQRARRLAALGAVGMLAADEVVQLLAHFVAQYRAAAANAEQLVTLRRNYRRVRLVAHSLGARHAIEAASLLDRELRPDEVHLCAPACREEEVTAKLDTVAARRCVVYYTSSDAVLEVAFRLLARGRAMGSAGLRRHYSSVVGVDVGAHFGFLVHQQYKHRLARFALTDVDD